MGAAAAAGITAGASLLGSAFGGNKSQSTGYTLPPLLEFQMLEDTQQSLMQLDQDIQQVDQVSQAYEKRINSLKALNDATIPKEEALAQLRESSMQIGMAMGASAEELVSNGFLDQEDIDDLAEMEAIAAEDFTDPRLDNELQDQKARLMQDLARSGAGPSQINQAMAQFERDAMEKRFTRSQELKQSQTGLIQSRIATRSGLRQEGLQSVMQAQNSLFQNLGFAREGMNQQVGFEQSIANMGLQRLQARSGLRQEQQQMYQNVGAFKLSKGTKRALERGEVPGYEPSQQFQNSQRANDIERTLRGWNRRNLSPEDKARLIQAYKDSTQRTRKEKVGGFTKTDQQRAAGKMLK